MFAQLTEILLNSSISERSDPRVGSCSRGRGFQDFHLRYLARVRAYKAKANERARVEAH